MAQISRGTARKFIDGVRRENGGLTKDDTEYLQKKPHLFEMYNTTRRELGASTRTYVPFSVSFDKLTCAK
jgi:hypothetical protein